MAYNCLNLVNGKIAFEQLQNSEAPDWISLVTSKGAGEPDPLSEVKELANGIRSQYRFPLTDGQASKFEAEIGVLLHELIDDSAAIGDPDFWRWVALGPLLEATIDRSSNSKGMGGVGNYGFGSWVECFPYRAWLRAEIGCDLTADRKTRYQLAMRGDQDFWRSHLIRIRYAFHKEMAHALIEFQNPTHDGQPLLKTADKTDGIRMLAKRLARTHANMAYPLLDREQCSCVISRLAHGLTCSNGSRYSHAGKN
jgi:hypothetical protein